MKQFDKTLGFIPNSFVPVPAELATDYLRALTAMGVKNFAFITKEQALQHLPAGATLPPAYIDTDCTIKARHVSVFASTLHHSEAKALLDTCTSSPAYRKLCERETREILGPGAERIIADAVRP